MELSIQWNLIRVLLLKGFLPTLRLIPLALVLSLLVGLLGGTLRVLRIPVLDHLLALYVYVLRGVPTILLMFICYFVLPTGSDPFAAAVLALVLANGAYMTEIVRGGLEAVDQGQRDAAKAIGMGFWQSIYYVVLPQSLLLIIPALVGQLVLLVKVTALASVIGYVELTKMAVNLIGSTMMPLPLFFYAGLCYFVVCHSLKMLADWAERWSKGKIMGNSLHVF
jgi:His/Glu/Gln/Arg/opine family amino acid ABC transporter permease subunit